MIAMKLLIVVVFVFATSILSVYSRGGRIYNGSTAKPEEFYYRMNLFIQINTINGTKVDICGGSLILDNWILTATHCVFNVGGKVENVLASFELYRNKHYVQNITAKRFITHEAYDETDLTLLNDIALVEIPKSSCTSNLRKIPLCKPGSFEGKYVTLSGYGMTENGKYATELRYAQLKVLNTTACAEKFGFTLQDNQFCTFEETKNACVGDSGSPAVIGSGESATLAGIIIFGEVECSPNTPAAYTRVSSYISWIESKTHTRIKTRQC